MLRCPSAESNPNDDIFGIGQEVVEKLLSGSSDYSGSNNDANRSGTPGDRTPPQSITPPRVSLMGNAVMWSDEPKTTPPKGGSNMVARTPPDNNTPRTSVHGNKGTPAKSPRTSILDNKPGDGEVPSSRSSFAHPNGAKKTPGRSRSTSIFDDNNNGNGSDRTPPKVTPPQTQRNSLAPPGGMADLPGSNNPSEHTLSNRPSDEAYDNEVTNSQRTSINSSLTSSSETPPDYDRGNRNSNPRRSGVSIQREGSLGNVQVRVKKRRRSSGERQSEVNLNVQVMAKRGVSERLSRQSSWVRQHTQSFFIFQSVLSF